MPGLNKVRVGARRGCAVGHLVAVPARADLRQRGRIAEPLRELLDPNGALQLLRLFQDLAPGLERRASLCIAASLLLLLRSAQGLA